MLIIFKGCTFSFTQISQKILDFKRNFCKTSHILKRCAKLQKLLNLICFDFSMIKIRKHLQKDIPYRVKWLNNPHVNKFIGDELGQKTNLQKEKKWFTNYKKAKNKKFFTICDDSKPIGFLGLSNISNPNKNADLFIAIGEDDYRGKGIGKISMKWIIDYGFTKLKLHKINLGVTKDNISAVKLYQSLGFVIEGEMRDEVFYEGKFYNFLSMAIFNRNQNKK